LGGQALHLPVSDDRYELFVQEFCLHDTLTNDDSMLLDGIRMYVLS